MFSPARQAEVIRCNQKDEYYTSYVRGSLANVVQSLCGPQRWLQWRKELDLVADVLYFGLTTCAGYQTVGEEYVNILPVDSSLRRLPTRLSRALMILLQVVTPYTLDYVLALVQRRLETGGGGAERLTPGARDSFLAHIPTARHLVALLHRCHLALFYVQGLFYHVAKRVTGTRYIQVRPGRETETSLSNYRLLGYLSAVQLAATCLLHAWRLGRARGGMGGAMGGAGGEAVAIARMNDASRIGGAGSAATALAGSSARCALCLERRTNSTATPCGHLFCWDCILEWCETKAECPLCREQFAASRLIHLQNYDIALST